jgi:hypothetical protein
LSDGRSVRGEKDRRAGEGSQRARVASPHR